MMRRNILFRVSVVASVTALSCVNAGVLLVEEDRARCTIVSGAEDFISVATTMERSDVTLRRPEGVLRLAAQDLADHLNDMAWLGRERFQVQVVDAIEDARTFFPGRIPAARILLGSAAIEAHGLHEEAATLPYMGYIYRTIGNDLVIFGSSSKGAANGVYGFLQDELGVRWFGPHELFRIVPRRKTISVGPLDRREAPDVDGMFSSATGGDWIPRMRLAQHGSAIRSFNPHWIKNILPIATYGDRPELYAIKNGQRLLDPNRFAVCYANPEVVQIAADYIKDYFRRNPNRPSYPLGANDSLSFCECPECAKLQPERTFRGLRVASDMWHHFVNAVAREVKAEFPDRWIATGASKDIILPPEGPIEDNVYVVLLNDVSEFYDPDFRAQEEEIVSAWAEKGIPLGMYYYTGLAKLVPAYFPRMLGEVLQNRHRQNFILFYTEAHPGWPWTGPMHYVQTRLWWDMNLDVDDLLDDYFTTLFGPAAAPMAALYDRFEEIHMRPRLGGMLFEHYNFAQFRPYNAEDLAFIREQLDAAHDAIEVLGVGRQGRDNIEGQRVAFVSNGIKVFLDMLEGTVIAREIEAWNAAEAPIDDVVALSRLHELQRIQTLLDRHEALYRETILSDTLHSNRFLNDTCVPVRNGWMRFLRKTSADTLAALYRARPDLDPRVSAGVNNTIDTFIHEPYSRATFTLATGSAVMGENRVLNPDFEQMDGVHPDYPERFNWTPFAADNWAHWQMVPGQGSFSLSEAVHSTGSRAAQLEGIGSGCLVGWIPGVRPEPGLYYVAVDTRIEAGRDDRTTARVILRWQDGESKWISGMDARIQQETQALEEWVRLEAVVEPPPEADTAVILLYVDSLQEGGRVYFDNVALKSLALPSTETPAESEK